MKLAQRLWARPRGFTYRFLLARGPAAPSRAGIPALAPQGAGSTGPRFPAAWTGVPLLYLTPLTSVGPLPSPPLSSQVTGVSSGREGTPIWDSQTPGKGARPWVAARQCQSGIRPLGHVPPVRSRLSLTPAGHAPYWLHLCSPSPQGLYPRRPAGQLHSVYLGPRQPGLRIQLG